MYAIRISMVRTKFPLAASTKSEILLTITALAEPVRAPQTETALFGAKLLLSTALAYSDAVYVARGRLVSSRVHGSILAIWTNSTHVKHSFLFALDSNGKLIDITSEL